MKLKDFKAIPWRIQKLITRKFTWVSEEGSYTSKEPFHITWAIVGIHSYRWWWVRKYGLLPCGCRRNPITRRFVSYLYGCPENHGSINTMLNLEDVE
jgi:hypothetical protein